MAKIYFVHHADTDFDKEGRVTAWIDEPINRDGLEDAYIIGQQFKDKPLSLIYSSDLKRAEQTASFIADETGAKVNDLKLLRPIDFGLWSGKKVEDVEPDMSELIEVWETNPWQDAPGGGSFEEFQNRQLAFWNSLLDNLDDDEEIAVVSHSKNGAWLELYIKNGRQPIQGEEVEQVCNYNDGNGKVTTINFKNEVLEVDGEIK